MQYRFSGFTALIWLFAEIAGFIIVGRAIGVLSTLGLVLLSMIAGLCLLRYYGIDLIKQVQNQLIAGQVLDRAVAQGAMAITGAMLLIIPGFISDIAGILLFVPSVRDLIWNFLQKRLSIRTRQAHSKRKTTTIDLDSSDYHATDPENSPWRVPNKKNHKK